MQDLISALLDTLKRNGDGAESLIEDIIAADEKYQSQLLRGKP